jgi:hypothetical protein
MILSTLRVCFSASDSKPGTNDPCYPDHRAQPGANNLSSKRRCEPKLRSLAIPARKSGASSRTLGYTMIELGARPVRSGISLSAPLIFLQFSI